MAGRLSAPSAPSSSSSDSWEVVSTFIFCRHRRLLQLHLRIILLIGFTLLCYLGGYYVDLLLACYACRGNCFTATLRVITKKILSTMVVLAVNCGIFRGTTLVMLSTFILSSSRCIWKINQSDGFSSRWCRFSHIHIAGVAVLFGEINQLERFNHH